MSAKEELRGVYLDNHMFTKEKVIELMEFYGDKKGKYEGEVAEYWHQRSKLADAYIKETPCDPDITDAQLKAWLEYQEFIKD